jgi:hypothetical protein
MILRPSVTKLTNGESKWRVDGPWMAWRGATTDLLIPTLARRSGLGPKQDPMPEAASGLRPSCFQRRGSMIP